MPFDGSGNFTPSAAPNFPAIGGAVISPTYYNAVINDIATGLSNCLTRDGQGQPSAAIDWNAKNLTNVGAFAAASATLTAALPVTSGGTGLTTAPANGALLIGNGTVYASATLTAGSGMTITNGSGTITITFSGGSALTGALTTATPASGQEALIIPHGVAPSAPTNGSLWTTTAGFYARINGATIGPMIGVQGGTFTGALVTVASASGGAGFNLPHGSAPSSPNNGDLWTTTSGLVVRINGATLSFLTSAGGTLTGAIVLAAGTTSLTPIQLQSGTLNTTPVAGGMEFDGTSFFLSKSATARMVVDTTQAAYSTGTLVNSASAQKLLVSYTNGAVTLVAGFYTLELYAHVNNMSGAQTVSLSFGGASSAVLYGELGVSKGNSATTSLLVGNAHTSCIVTSPSDSQTSAQLIAKAMLRVDTAGTFIPLIETSIGNASANCITFVKITQVGSSSFTNVGNWS